MRKKNGIDFGMSQKVQKQGRPLHMYSGALTTVPTSNGVDGAIPLHVGTMASAHCVRAFPCVSVYVLLAIPTLLLLL